MNIDVRMWMMYYDRQEIMFLKDLNRFDRRMNVVEDSRTRVRRNVKTQEWIDRLGVEIMTKHANTIVVEAPPELGGQIGETLLVSNCPDCGVAPGKQHIEGCDVECCPECGGQYMSCGCEEKPEHRLPWKSEWPGVVECREFGWYAKMVPGKGWVRCDKSEPGASEDLNRLHMEAVWSKKQGRFILSLEG